MEEEAIQQFTAEEKRWKLESGASKVPQITGAVAGMLFIVPSIQNHKVTAHY
jgi:hypothetical protein